MHSNRRYCLAAIIGLVAQACRAPAPEDVVAGYLRASRWEDRPNYVLEPDVVRPLMAAYYEKTVFPVTFQSIEQVRGSVVPTEEDAWVDVRVVFGQLQNLLGAKIDQATVYQLQLTSNGFKIDWEASVGLCDLPWRAFKVQRPSRAIQFRVFGQLDDYYNYDFAGRESQMHSIRLMHQDYIGDDLHGYIDKSSSDGQGLYSVLKDGQWHSLILRMGYLPNSKGDVLAIAAFVQEGFSLRRGTEP